MKAINKIILLFGIAVIALSTTSCLKDNPIVDWKDIKYVIEIPNKSHYILKQRVKTTENQEFNLMVNYTIDDISKVKEDIQVQLGIDESMVATYNAGLAASTQKYILLPAETYNLPSQVTIKKGTRLWEDNMTVNTSMLSKGVKYILPIRITNVPAGYTISGNFGHLYLRIDMSN